MKKFTTYVRLIFESILNILLSLCFLPSLIFCNKFSKTQKQNLFIFGNGPSLHNNINLLFPSLPFGQNLICTNNFMLTDYFYKYKPKYYILVDPVFFRDTPVQEVNKKLVKMKHVIKNSLSWEMHIIIPWNFRFSNFAKFLKGCDNIKLNYLRNTPLWGGLQRINVLLLRMGIGNPPFQNVVVSAIFWGILSRFNSIYLLGVDHSWIYNIVVGTDNKLRIKNEHFYGTGNHVVHTTAFGIPISLRDELDTMKYTLDGYHLLEAYSKYKKIKIYNCTDTSLIDAFEKIEST